MPGQIVVLVVVLAVLWPCRRLLSDTEVLDLKVYLAGGRAVLHGHDLYSPDVGVRQYGFTYPPFAALLFALPSLLPLGLAIVLMTLLSLAALAVSIGLSDGDLMRRVAHGPSWATLAVVAALIGCQPVRTTLWNGQIDLVLAALVMVDLIGRRGATGEGVLVGIAAAIKLTPAIFIGYLLLRRRFRAAATAAAAFAVVTGASWLLLPHDSTTYWTRTLIHGTGLGDITRASNQSILGVAERLAGARVAEPLWAALILPVAVVGLGIAARISADGREAFALSVVGLTGCLISPVSWSHHWVWFVPWIAGLVTATPNARNARVLATRAFVTYLVVINLVSQSMIHAVTVVRVLVQSSYSLAVAVAALFVLVPWQPRKARTR